MMLNFSEKFENLKKKNRGSNIRIKANLKFESNQRKISEFVPAVNFQRTVNLMTQGEKFSFKNIFLFPMFKKLQSKLILNRNNVFR